MNQLTKFAKEIADTRFVKIHEMSSMLEQIKRLALDHLGYVPKPTMKDGVAFYPVGSNASHHFSLGVKDGKLMRRSQCYDSWIDGNGEYQEHEEDNVYEIPKGIPNYLGNK